MLSVQGTTGSDHRRPPGQTPPVNRAEHEGHGSKDEVRPSDCGSESAATSGPHWILCNIRKKALKMTPLPAPPTAALSVGLLIIFFFFVFCFVLLHDIYFFFPFYTSRRLIIGVDWQCPVQ